MDREMEFDRVYRQYADLIYRYLCRIGCPPQDAEDVLHDTFVKALLGIDSYRGDGKLSTWLCQIAANTWKSQLKKQQRNTEAPLPESGTADEQLWQWLDLLESLEEPYRSVFMKKALGDWNYEELSHAYGKSESWARVTYYRARLQLQKLLKEGRS